MTSMAFFPAFGAGGPMRARTFFEYEPFGKDGRILIGKVGRRVGETYLREIPPRLGMSCNVSLFLHTTISCDSTDFLIFFFFDI